MTYRLSSTIHLLTIDLRDYFHDVGFGRVAPPEHWATLEPRIDQTVDQLLGQLDAASARATFFVPGSIARRHREALRRIALAGHELAAHGDVQLLSGALTEEHFRDEARSSKAEIEHVTGTHVTGFRAPFCPLTPSRGWALEILIEEGYEYDSSCLPRAKVPFGEVPVPEYAHMMQCAAGTLMEIPPTPIHYLGRTAMPGIVSPLRAAPYAAVRRTFEERTRGGLPGVLSLAAWEIDAQQPRLAAPITARVRHYSGLRSVARKLERAVSDFRFDAVANGLPELGRSAPITDVA